MYYRNDILNLHNLITSVTPMNFISKTTPTVTEYLLLVSEVGVSRVWEVGEGGQKEKRKKN